MTFLAEPLPGKAVEKHVIFVDAVRSRRGSLNFGPPAAAPPSDRGSLSPLEQSFVDWLFHRAKLSPDAYREETLIRRLPACLRLVRARTVEGARSAIESDPSLFWSAVGALVIGVTSFFRDPQVFSTLADRVIPALTVSGKPLRVWSVGCSDGQELYSVGMMLSQAGWLHRSDLLGTDCRLDAIRRASAGVYEEREIRSVPDPMMHYFHRTAHGWSIDPRIRTVIQWRTADAIQMVEPGAWDLIFCRNFIMYLEPHVASALWEQLYRSLRAGGILVVGKAERPGVEGCYPIAPCIFRKSRG